MRDGPRQPLNRESNKLAPTIYTPCPCAVPIIPLPGLILPGFAFRHVAAWFHIRQKKKCCRNRFSHSLNNVRFLRLHTTLQCTCLTPVGNRCITPCVCVKDPSRARGVLPTDAGRWVVRGSAPTCQEVDCRAEGWPGGGVSCTRRTEPGTAPDRLPRPLV